MVIVSIKRKMAIRYIQNRILLFAIFFLCTRNFLVYSKSQGGFMEKDVEKHFNEFYNKLVFLDRKLGGEEKTFKRDNYFTVDNGILSIVNEEYEKDEEIYIRDKGLVLTFVYGGVFNKKHKSLEIYISKDPYYKENDTGSIKDLLLLVDEFIERNYKEFYEKINKIIFGTDNSKNKRVKYRTSNILNKDYIRVIKINDAVVKDEDIDKIKTYPNLRELSIINSVIDAKNLSNLKLMVLGIRNSFINNIRALNNMSCGSLRIADSKFMDSRISPINLNVGNIRLINLNIDYELLFIMTNFSGLDFMGIDRYQLKPMEVEFLRALCTAREINADGCVNSYDFFKDLPELESFKGYIESLDEEWFVRGKELYKKYIKRFELETPKEIKEFLFSREVEKILTNNKSFRNIRLSKVALTKWCEKIKTAVADDVRDIYKLSCGARKTLGNEREISFVETEIIDPFNILLRETNDFYLSKIVGPDGQRLMKPDGSRYTDYYYILGSNGKIIERIEKTKERDVVIPEYIQEHRNIVVNNTNNVFDYYYNRQISEKDKVTYLTYVVKEFLDKQDSLEFDKDFNYNSDLFKKIKSLEEKVESLSEFGILYSTPRHKYETIETTFQGEVATMYKEIPDDFIKEDSTLLKALFRTRDFDVIRYSLEEIFKEKVYDFEEQEKVVNDIKKLLECWEKIDLLKSEATPLDKIVEFYIEILFKDLTGALEDENYRCWYLSDIERFLDSYNLDSETREMLVNYILLRQCSNRVDLLDEKNENENRLWEIEEYDSIIGSSDFYEVTYGTGDFSELYSRGIIKEEEYKRYLEYLALLDRNAELESLLDVNSVAREKAYYEMMPRIDKFTLEDLLCIKNGVVLAGEYEDKFTKFVDYLYFYIFGKYPEWVTTELRKCPEILDKYESEIHREVVPEKNFHVKERVKVNKNYWEFM